MVELAIQTIKTLLKKAKATRQDPYIALLQLRNAPCADGPSPAQLLMGRRLRANLPATDAYLKIKTSDPKETTKMWVIRKKEREKYYNKSARIYRRTHLQPGSKVYMQKEPKGSWQPAAVVSAATTPRIYII